MYIVVGNCSVKSLCAFQTVSCLRAVRLDWPVPGWEVSGSKEKGAAKHGVNVEQSDPIYTEDI